MAIMDSKGTIGSYTVNTRVYSPLALFVEEQGYELRLSAFLHAYRASEVNVRKPLLRLVCFS